MAEFWDLLNSPLGPILAVVDGEGRLTRLDFVPEGAENGATRRWKESAVWEPEKLAPCRNQLADYFSGQRRSFDLDLAPVGTQFQQRVWAALATIPYGETRAYLDIARAVESPGSVRAVGAANGRNPIAIVIPCHRVVGSNGSLTGYAGGLAAKRFLLRLEGCEPGHCSLQYTLF